MRLPSDPKKSLKRQFSKDSAQEINTEMVQMEESTTIKERLDDFKVTDDAYARRDRYNSIKKLTKKVTKEPSLAEQLQL